MELNSLETHRKESCTEQGAVLILLAVVASALFAFIALGIDTGLLSVSRRDHSNMAPKVASAALNAFTHSTATSFDDRMEEARARAEEISQIAIDIATTSYFLKGGAYNAEIGSASSPGETGYIEAGIWHFVPTFSTPYFDTAGACIKRNAENCPCNTSSEWNGPCFEKLSNSDFTPPSDPNIPFTPPKVTAIRVKLHTREDSPVETKFAQTFGGQSNFRLEASATVASRPMRVVYIVDLSRSSHQETHLPFEMVGVMQAGKFNAAEYAFKLKNKSCETEPAPPNDNTSNDLAYVQGNLTCKPIAGVCGATNKNPPLGPSDCELDGGLAFSGVNGAYDALFNYCDPFVFPPGKPAATSLATWHSKADYRCVTVNPEIAGVAQGNTHYLVDAFRNNNYQGPEPLSTMNQAILQGVNRFNSRGIDGDRLGVIGVDHEAQIDQRTFGLSEPKSTDATYQKIQQVFADDADFTLRHKDHIWFPREDAMFNLPDALRAAYTMLTKDPEFHYSDNHVIVITDGISECYLDTNSNKQVCAASQAAVEQSLSDAYDLVEDNFVSSDIRLNVLLLGDLVQPHALVKKSKAPGNQDRCMDEDEARNTVLANGDPEPWVNTSDNSASYRDATQHPDTGFDSSSNSLKFSPDSRFHTPNKLHAAVAITGGVWGIIRPPCQPTVAQSSGSSCQDGGLQNYLDTQCAAAAAPGDLVTNINGTGGEKIVDGNGRLVCDSKCQDRSTQIKAYIDEIFDSFPYLAVQNNIQVY